MRDSIRAHLESLAIEEAKVVTTREEFKEQFNNMTETVFAWKFGTARAGVTCALMPAKARHADLDAATVIARRPST
jgi:hypothetical protein